MPLALDHKKSLTYTVIFIKMLATFNWRLWKLALGPPNWRGEFDWAIAPRWFDEPNNQGTEEEHPKDLAVESTNRNQSDIRATETEAIKVRLAVH